MNPAKDTSTLNKLKTCNHVDKETGFALVVEYHTISGTTVRWCTRCGSFKYSNRSKWIRPTGLKDDDSAH